ncbi:MAG: putative membrane protein [Crocinitomicaceae bacterium]|jgi:uncharacterized membrane protein
MGTRTLRFEIIGSQKNLIFFGRNTVFHFNTFLGKRSNKTVMIALLREKNYLNEFLYLAIASTLCFLFSLFRVFFTDSGMYLFLNWNLFLAFVPWALSLFVLLKPKIQTKKRTLILLLGVWLLFFPNAPYILTDLFHLTNRAAMPKWFDLILILSFAWVGLIFAFLSLRHIEILLAPVMRQKRIAILSSSLLFIGSFGIYLGRYLRWNSWDIVQHPFDLMYDVGNRVVSPFEYPRAWGVTIFMGIFLNMIYWSLKLIKKQVGQQ